MEIRIEREIYTAQATGGKMFIDNEFFCYTLEDTVRPIGIKVKHHTAIHEGRFKVVLTYSNRFKREMPLLVSVPLFKGIRMHGGNTHYNTSGCPLVAYNRTADDKIQGTAEKELTEKIRLALEEGEVFITLVNKIQ